MLRQKRAKLARLARADLYAFAQFVAPPEYQFSWHHRLLYRELDDFARGLVPRLLIMAPPGHGKSEAISRNLPAYLLGQNPDARLIACSYTADLASEMNRDVQRSIDADGYRELFPATTLSAGRGADGRRRDDLFDVVGRRGYYKSAGVGGGITGRRFDYGLIDDPVKDRETANSPARREAVWRWYTGVFTTRAAKSAAVCLTLTRWHDDDLAGRILRAEPGRWRVVKLPALAEPGQALHPDDPRQPGEALWPWFKCAEELAAQAQLEPRDFAALYQQEPTAEGGVEWPAAYFHDRLWFDDWPSGLGLRVVALDPSKGRDAAHGDYSAFVCFARSQDGTLWVEADLARRPTTQIVADGLELARRFPAETHGTLDAFGVEANAFQELLADEFARQSKAAGVMLPIYKVTNTTNKLVRIRRLTPYLAAGNVRFRATPGTRLLVSQLRDFPVGAHDDGPDALEMALRLAVELHNGRQKKGGRR